MGLLGRAAGSVARAASRKVAASVAEVASRKVGELTDAGGRSRVALAAQRTEEERVLPVVALVGFTWHELRTWKGYELEVTTPGGSRLYGGRVNWYDFDSLRRSHAGVIESLSGDVVAEISLSEGAGGGDAPEIYLLSGQAIEAQRLLDVTQRMISKPSDAARSTFKSLEPMGWIFRRDSAETLHSLADDTLPSGVWRVGYGSNITARVERPGSLVPHEAGSLLVRCRDESALVPLVLFAIAVSGRIDRD